MLQNYIRIGNTYYSKEGDSPIEDFAMQQNPDSTWQWFMLGGGEYGEPEPRSDRIPEKRTAIQLGLQRDLDMLNREIHRLERLKKNTISDLMELELTVPA